MKHLLYLSPIYLIIIILSYFNILPKSNLIYGLIAVIITITLILNKSKDQIKLNKYLILLAFLLILTPRIIPYINNDIPIGYDTGIYKYAIEHPTEDWIQKWMPRGFTVPMGIINLFLPINFILTYLLIGFELLLGFAIYKTVKLYFNRNTGIISLLLFSISFTQFNVFTFMYYKNIIALSLLLFSFYFLKKNRIIFIIIASLLGSLHKPTFLIFSLSYLIYTIINYKTNLKKNIINGIIILILTLLSYIGILKESLFPGLKGAIGLEIGAGTFLGIIQYQTLFLILLPFMFLGIYVLFRLKKINILFIWFIVNLIIVSFKLIFFNRFIIHLDIILIILASIGIYLLIKKHKILGITALIIILMFSSYILFNESINTKPLINKAKLEEIKTLQNIEGYVMSTHKNDSPWLLGYSKKKTIAPGLFKWNNWTKEEWAIFWYSDNITQVKPLLDIYEKPIYIYIHPSVNKEKFKNNCFEIKGNIYKYVC